MYILNVGYSIVIFFFRIWWRLNIGKLLGKDNSQSRFDDESSMLKIVFIKY